MMMSEHVSGVMTVIELSSRVDATPDAEAGNSPYPGVKVILEQYIEENNRRREGLSALQARMQKVPRQWRGMDDGIPSADSVCRLIEAIDA